VNQRRLSKVGLLLAAALAFGAACRGGASQPTLTTLPSPETSATATVEPGPTDDPSLIEPIISALRSADPEAIRPHIGFKQVPCSATPSQGPGGPPACASGEQDGQQVDSFYYSTCEGQYLRSTNIEEPLGVMAGTSLYAIYRLPPDKRANGQYSAILVDQNEPRLGQAWEAIIDNERIVALIFSCVVTPQEYVQLRGYADAVLPPQTS
jgi:hypothetical protein